MSQRGVSCDAIERDGVKAMKIHCRRSVNVNVNETKKDHGFSLRHDNSVGRAVSATQSGRQADKLDQRSREKMLLLQFLCMRAGMA